MIIVFRDEPFINGPGSGSVQKWEKLEWPRATPKGLRKGSITVIIKNFLSSARHFGFSVGHLVEFNRRHLPEIW